MLCKHVVRIEAEKATLELEHVFFGERSGARINIMRADDDKIRAIDVPAGYFGASDPRNFLGIYKTEPVGVLGFIKAVREGHRPEPGFDVGVKVQEVVDAALVSGRERRVVDL